MANRPHFAGWPAQQPGPGSGPVPAPYGQITGGEFRPGMPFPQHSLQLSSPGFHQFPPRGSGALPGPPGGLGPPGHGAYRNVYPPGARSPGFNNSFQGWSPYPRGYPVTGPTARTTSPSVINSQLQSFVPGLGYGAQGNNVSVGPSSQGQGQGQQGVQARHGLHGPIHDSRGAAVGGHSVSEVVPWSNDLRPNLGGKSLFLNWIDESVKDSSSSKLLGDSGDRGSGLRISSNNSAVPKSSDLYRLVDQVEDTIGKILALTDFQTLTSRTEWGVCPFNPQHVVPAEALLRHTLQCPSSLGGTVEASSCLQCLQYSHTVDLDPTEPFTHDEKMNDRHPGAESSSNDATLSFENAALFSVNYTPTRRLDLEIIKQETGYADTENSSEIPRGKAKVETTNWSEKPECRTLTLSVNRQQFDPRGSLFFYGDAPGVVLTSLAHYSSKGFGDAMSSMPHSLRVELEKCPYVSFKSVRNDETKNRSILPSSRTIGNTGLGNRHTEEEEKDQEPHGVVKGSIAAKRIGMTDSEADWSLTRIQHVGEREETACVGLLPSMLLNLGKELETWKDLPSQCSRTVLEAAICLRRVRKASIVEWLLVHSPAYGVILDVAMAAHLSCLVQLYLKALRTQSLLLFDQSFARDSNKRDTSISSDAMVLECPIYAEASIWLASWLSHLYGPLNSKAVVLDILKHCLNSCGRFLSVVPLDLHSQQDGCKTRGKTEDVKGASDEFKVFMEHSKMLPKRAVNALEDTLGVKQVGAAMDAVYERANFERYIKSWMSINNATKPQRIANYDMTVMSANNERAKRPNYHAVCEHDGLTWQRSHQEENRNKTKAELLAEERDYKRRRMSYRGKKLKRTPLQVLHDIIENHMTEITEAGGIGCFSKQPLRIPFEPYTDLGSEQQVQGSIPSKPDFQHHSGSANYSKMTNNEMAGNVPRLYDGHRGTSSAVRSESRSSSQSRYGDERHHNSRR